MDWSYLAGFFDGEGNLHVHPIKSNKGEIKSYQLMIRIYSTNKPVLEKMKEFIQIGNIYDKSYRFKVNPTWNILSELTITKKEECLFFLKNILPYLVIKKDQVEYLLNNFDFSMGSRRRKGHTNLYFDVEKFRGFNSRANTSKFIKNYIVKPPTE